MRIMAIDQARNGAWSVFDYEKKRLIKYGSWSFDAKHYTYAKAILEIEKLIDSLIKKYGVAAVFIEDIQLRVNVQAFKRLAQLQGVLVNLFEKNEYLYDYVAPAKWQNYCKARGRTEKEIKASVKHLDTNEKKESKRLSIQFAKEQFGVETDNDNEADSLGIGWFVCNNIQVEDLRDAD